MSTHSPLIILQALGHSHPDSCPCRQDPGKRLLPVLSANMALWSGATPAIRGLRRIEPLNRRVFRVSVSALQMVPPRESGGTCRGLRGGVSVTGRGLHGRLAAPRGCRVLPWSLLSAGQEDPVQNPVQAA